MTAYAQQGKMTQRVLFIVGNFRQGWGGATESVRLTAHEFYRLGFQSDVLDGQNFFRDVQQYDVLPQDSRQASQFHGDLTQYTAILHIGPWQNPLGLMQLVRKRGPIPYYYLPRGGLANIEFARRRDLKKWPYALALERWFIGQADGVIYSSALEQQALHWTCRSRTPSHIIPDYFSSLDTVEPRTRQARQNEWAIGFMAEISPRKGLLPFVHGLSVFARRHAELTLSFRLGGMARKGAERYQAEVDEALADVPANLTVERLGRISHEARTRFYHSMDLFAAPSLFESFGLTVLESLQLGTPVLAAPELGVLEFVYDTPLLTIADSPAPADFASALEACWSAHQRATPSATSPRQLIHAMNARADQNWLELPGFIPA